MRMIPMLHSGYYRRAGKEVASEEELFAALAQSDDSSEDEVIAAICSEKHSRYLQNKAMRTLKQVLQDKFGFL